MTRKEKGMFDIVKRIIDEDEEDVCPTCGKAECEGDCEDDEEDVFIDVESKVVYEVKVVKKVIEGKRWATTEVGVADTSDMSKLKKLLKSTVNQPKPKKSKEQHPLLERPIVYKQITEQEYNDVVVSFIKKQRQLVAQFKQSLKNGKKVKKAYEVYHNEFDSTFEKLYKMYIEQHYPADETEYFMTNRGKLDYSATQAFSDKLREFNRYNELIKCRLLGKISVELFKDLEKEKAELSNIDNFLSVGLELTYNYERIQELSWLFNSTTYNSSGQEDIVDTLMHSARRCEKQIPYHNGRRGLYTSNSLMNSELNIDDWGMDGYVAEITTHPLSSKQSVKRTWDGLEKHLKAYELISSSLVDLQDEGGCHINIDAFVLLPFLLPLKGLLEEAIDEARWFKAVETKEVDRLMLLYNKLRDTDIALTQDYRKLCSYIQHNPFIAWYFLSPYDNVSSVVNYSMRSKDDAMILNDGAASPMFDFEEDYNLDFVELRFFMMPRDWKEMELHLDFAQALTKHWLKGSMNNIPDLKQEGYNKLKKEYRKYNLKKCQEGMKKVCNEIGFDYNRIIECGKEDLLKQRLSFGDKFKI